MADFLVMQLRHRRKLTRSAAANRDPHLPAIDVRYQREFLDMRCRHRFQPHRLPDAGYRGIPDAAGIEYLLAARMHLRIGGIPNSDHDLLRARAGFQLVGDIERKRIVTAIVLADGLSVDPDLRSPVHRTKMQQHPASFGRRDSE
jgi:hypothetical protein